MVGLVCGCSETPVETTAASTPAATDVAQQRSDDPCSFATAETVAKEFGRSMKSQKFADVCQYRGDGFDVVTVQVSTGEEGTILRHIKSVIAQGIKGPEQVTTKTGEAYFDGTIEAFVGRVGNHNVQIESTIEPLPREAMIALGTRILETLARQ